MSSGTSDSDERLVFLSYTVADRDRVSEYYSQLRSDFNVWMDAFSIKVGQNWEFEIQKAQTNASIVVLFISKKSIDKRGYVQKEMNFALEKKKEKLIDDIYIIPVLLEEMEPPPQIEDIHILYDYKEGGVEKLKDAINTQLERLGEKVVKAQEQSDVRWTYVRYAEAWEGLPGYDLKSQLVRFGSETYPFISQITDEIKGRLTVEFMKRRAAKFRQASDFFNFGQSAWQRTDTFDATCSNIHIEGGVISVEYNFYTYMAGGAHGFAYAVTFVYTINPLTKIEPLSTAFQDEQKALPEIQAEVRRQLLGIQFGEGEEQVGFDPSWVENGTAGWADFSAFLFTANGLELLFAPYQVAAYAFGPQRAVIPYKTLRALMLPHYLSVLGRAYPVFGEDD